MRHEVFSLLLGRFLSTVCMLSLNLRRIFISFCFTCFYDVRYSYTTEVRTVRDHVFVSFLRSCIVSFTSLLATREVPLTCGFDCVYLACAARFHCGRHRKHRRRCGGGRYRYPTFLLCGSGSGWQHAVVPLPRELAAALDQNRRARLPRPCANRFDHPNDARAPRTAALFRGFNLTEDNVLPIQVRRGAKRDEEL